MKTRKLAAKILATACLAVGISGVAFASHKHTLTIDPGVDLYISSTPASGTATTQIGSASTIDMDFSGEAGDGWGYYLGVELNTKDATTDAAGQVNYDGNVSLWKSFGKLTVTAGQIWDGSSNNGGWDIVEHTNWSVGPSHGVKAYFKVMDALSIGVHVGQTEAQEKMENSIVLSGSAAGASYSVALGSDGNVSAGNDGKSSMFAHVAYGISGINIRGEYNAVTSGADAKTTTITGEVTMTKGEIRPGAVYITQDAAGTKGSSYGVKVKYIPAKGGGFTYSAGYTSQDLAGTGAATKISVGISNSFNILN